MLASILAKAVTITLRCQQYEMLQYRKRENFGMIGQKCSVALQFSGKTFASMLQTPLSQHYSDTSPKITVLTIVIYVLA